MLAYTWHEKSASLVDKSLSHDFFFCLQSERAFTPPLMARMGLGEQPDPSNITAPVMTSFNNESWAQAVKHLSAHPINGLRFTSYRSGCQMPFPLFAPPPPPSPTSLPPLPPGRHPPFPLRSLIPASAQPACVIMNHSVDHCLQFCPAVYGCRTHHSIIACIWHHHQPSEILLHLQVSAHVTH